jgi:hypothetical protein
MGLYDTPEFRAFFEESPVADQRPGWWLAPPGMVEEVMAKLRPWFAGKVRQQPDFAPLVPTDVDFTQPWPWCADGDQG